MLYTCTSVKTKMMITYASGLVNIDGAEIVDEKVVDDMAFQPRMT